MVVLVKIKQLIRGGMLFGLILTAAMSGSSAWQNLINAS